MKKRPEMSDRLKTIILASACAAILLVSALLPLAFRSTAEESEVTLGERADLFTRYWKGGAGLQVKMLAEPTKAQIKAGEELLVSFAGDYIPDKKINKPMPSGREYFSVSDGEQSIQLCRMWMEQQGDWQNWLDLCFDLETGDIYYLYLSSECLFNGNSYLNIVDDDFDAEDVADIVADVIGYELEYLIWSGNREDTATAVYISGGSAVCVEINCSYYEATLIDVKLCCS